MAEVYSKAIGTTCQSRNYWPVRVTVHDHKVVSPSVDKEVSTYGLERIDGRYGWDRRCCRL